MNYRLEDIDNMVFEDLIGSICYKILGTGLVVFTSGKDGGRDGRFTGTANNYPSNKDSWSGKFIIQAKHTQNPTASISDYEFEKIVDGEIIRLKKLRKNGDIDNYLLFTNRKQTGVKGERLIRKLQESVGITNCDIIGRETIYKEYLDSSKDIIKQFKLGKYSTPFDFSDEEIRDTLIAFKQQLPEISEKIKDEVDKLKNDYRYIDKDEKNRKNNLSQEYFSEIIVGESLIDFRKIDHFLSNPTNEIFKDYYFDTANELNNLIVLKRDEFDLFEEIFIFIYQQICNRNSQLKGGKRHTMTFLHYMYYECLIGKK